MSKENIYEDIYGKTKNRKDVKNVIGAESPEDFVVNKKQSTFTDCEKETETVKEESIAQFRAWIDENGELNVTIKAKDVKELRNLVDTTAELIRGY